MAFQKPVKGVCPSVCCVQLLRAFDLTVFQQIDRDAVISVVRIAVRPDLTDGKLTFVVSFHMEDPVHFTYAVGVLVVQLDGDAQLDFQRGRLAGAEGAEKLIAFQSVQLVGRSVIDQLRAVPDLHGKLGQELRHGCDGLRLRNLGAERIFRLVMRLGSHVEIHEIAVVSGVGEGDGLRHGIAGHDVFEASEQVGLRVLTAGLEIEAFREPFKCDGGRRCKGRC